LRWRGGAISLNEDTEVERITEGAMLEEERGSPARRFWGLKASRDLRRRATLTEKLLWEQLRHHRLDGKQYRRQHSIGPYIVDFVCPQDGLIIEIDGEIHEQQRENDAMRDDYLRSLGYTVLRFTNDQVLDNLEGVLSVIRAVSTSSPLHRNGEGAGGGASPATQPETTT
jgi:very-short-patch-repair endonuclease